MSIILTADTADTLTSVARLTQNAQLAAVYAVNPTLVLSLLDAATAAIQRETKRLLLQATYAEYVSGGNYPYDQLFLKEFPVTAVTRVATNPQAVLVVYNTNATLNQRATIATTAGGVTLARVASGVATSSALSASDYPTLSAMAGAINALGNGWSATVAGPYASHPTTDLRPSQGAYTALNGGASLEMFVEEIVGPFAASDAYAWGCNYGWRLDDGAGVLYGRFPHGHLNVRVDYTAGFAVVPEDLQEACVQLVLDFYNGEVRDQTQASGTMGQASFANIKSHMSPKVRSICASYMDRGKLSLHR